MMKMLNRRVIRNRSTSPCAFLFLAFVLFCPVFVLFALISSSSSNNTQSKADIVPPFDVRMAQLQDQLEHLRLMDREKSKAFLELKEQIDWILKRISKSDLKRMQMEGYVDMQSHANKTREAVAKIMTQLASNATFALHLRQDLISNLTCWGHQLATPNLYDLLPHLLKAGTNALTPALRLSRNKKNVHTVIGIPTTQRPKVSYLVQTLRSLLDNLEEEDRSQVLIVVFFAEENGISQYVSEQVLQLQSEFSEFLDSGVLEVLVPPPSYYPPDLDHIPSTFNDPPERMRWRTKQNLDYAYLMMYCQNKARFYLQLEDDVVTKANYMAKIRDFISRQSGVPWMLLEFSSLGFIGKLFKSSDLASVVDFILIFHRQKPVDWLLDHIFYVKYCSPEIGIKQCQNTKNKYRLRLKPSLFQHIGMHSSLKGKVQKLKERDFGKQTMHRPHSDNPTAAVSSSLKAYQKFVLEKAYSGDSFFWGLLPQAGDWIRFDFNPPILLEGFSFRSGNADHPDDRFFNSTVEIKFDKKVGAGTIPFIAQNGPPTRTEDDFWVVGEFSGTGSAQASGLNTSIPVAAMRIVVHAESNNWVIMNEIWIRPIR